MQKNVAAPPMARRKPTMVWAYVGLITGVLAWLTAAPLPLIDYGYIAGATAGVGLAGPFLLGLLSMLLCSLGLVFGIVAVIMNTRRRGAAWAAVALIGLLAIAYLAVIGLFLIGADVFRR
jgi:hypothetical protein